MQQVSFVSASLKCT